MPQCPKCNINAFHNNVCNRCGYIDKLQKEYLRNTEYKNKMICLVCNKELTDGHICDVDDKSQIQKEEKKLISCLDCEKEISINAEACPHCGAITELKKKKNSNSNLVKVIFILALVIIAIWAFSTYQSNKYFYIPYNLY